MSRCFPFPPPGYEKKIRTDEAAAASLIKEKQKKEKKHKKEKKDKEKKEGKDSKDKETSRDKHKERKEKHKDRKDKEKGSRTSEDKRAAGVLTNTGDGEKLVTNNGNGESKFIQDLARRIRDEEDATESQSVGKIIRNDDERSTHKRPENAVRQKGTEVMFKPLEKKKMEVKENNHHRESDDMPLDSEGIRKSEPKYTAHRSSKDKKEEETKAISKLKDVEGGTKSKERDVVDTRNFRVQEDLSRESVKNLTSDGKRKDLETNGFLHENGSRPNKILHMQAASPVSSVENGRKLEACQTPLKPETVRNSETKEHRANGFIKSQEPKSRPTIEKKRPHSDLKYLDQILNVPKREEVDGTEDQQEWLFGQPGVKLLKKPKTDSSTSMQVWNQSLSIESADIVALPYVVPF